MTDDVDAHVEDITKALGDKLGKEVTKDELADELQKFLEYGVPLDQAKQTILKKFGGDSVAVSEGKVKPIEDIQPNQSSVDLVGRIITVNSKDITARGENKTIFYGILGDDSGTIPFTAWNDFGLEKGQVVKISNAYTKEWQGAPQVNLGDRTNVEQTDEDQVASTGEPQEYDIDDLKPGIGLVETTGRLLDVTEREVEVSGEKKKVFSGVIGDETGKAQFTSWHDFGLSEGDVIKLSGGYVKSWRGIPQLTFDERCTVDKLDSDKIPEDKVKTPSPKIGELVEKGGGIDVEVKGVILEVRKASGFVMRCPECNRVLQNGACNVHGDVKGSPDLRAKLVVDDGTGAVNVILNRELTENLFGKSLDECKQKVDETDDTAVVEKEIEDMFVNKPLRLKGNALTDDFGTSFIAREADFVTVDVKEEASQLLEEMEDMIGGVE